MGHASARYSLPEVRMWWRIGGGVGALGVVLGAFGAHGLKQVVTDAHRIEVWDTAARYHLIHAVALLVLAAHPSPPRATGWLWLGGIAVFSGSLYLLSLTGILWLGAITPIGGVLFIAGWLSLAFGGRSSA